MANPPLLRLAAQGPAMTEETLENLERCFMSRNSLRPFAALLGLSRRDLLREARSRLPLWQVVPVVSGFLRLLLRLLQRGDGFASSSDEPVAYRPPTIAESGGLENGKKKPAGAQSARFQRAVRALLVSRLPPGGKLAQTLEGLAERWNPLVDPVEKQNLVNDINALARDFIRPLRRSLLAHPPDEGRVITLAEELAATRNLAKINRRESLVRYLTLYILKILSS